MSNFKKIPLTLTELLILKTLNERSISYGYDIMKDIEKNYCLKFNASAIYPSLNNLHDKDYVSFKWTVLTGKRGNKTDRPVKNFVITTDGLKALEKTLTILKAVCCDE